MRKLIPILCAGSLLATLLVGCSKEETVVTPPPNGNLKTAPTDAAGAPQTPSAAPQPTAE